VIPVLGASFNPGTDGARESPAILLAGMGRRGATVRVCDPVARARRSMPSGTLRRAWTARTPLCWRRSGSGSVQFSSVQFSSVQFSSVQEVRAEGLPED